MTADLVADIVGLFVGCDGHPDAATCTFHDEPRTLHAGDTIQLEVELVDGTWMPLFHRCATHARETFPPSHAVHGVEQLLISATLAPTGAFLPESDAYHPDALTVSDLEIVAHSPQSDGCEATLTLE